ncbi:MAG: efflux RND transporter periplasmic adaptor subunit [Wenzhouxiangella sp.]
MNYRIAGIILFVLLLAGCGEDDETSSERRTAVTVAEVIARTVEDAEVSVGRLVPNSAPAVAAETAGRVSVIHRDDGDRVEAGELLAELEGEPQRIAVNSARADVRRLEAMLANERKRVARLSDLAERQSVAQDQLDEATTRVQSLEAELDAARSRLDDAEYNLERSRIVSPVAGRIQQRLVSVGDFVSPGRTLFELVAPDALRAVLPLPEHLQDRVDEGQVVRMSIPARPDEEVVARISEIRPRVGAGSRAIELIVDIDNPGTWRAGGSVTARVVLDERESLVVPAGSVVRRPAGTVVYVVDEETAIERPVVTGLSVAEGVEILDGLEAGETVVVDGAGFLSDGAAVDVKQAGEGQ